ncbi:MAG: hypothetical protein RLZZ214_3924 [Verrucomicrobiota bacterium]
MRIWLSWLVLSAPALLSAESAVRKDVLFSITEDVGFGNEVCVFGNHPQFGGGDPLKAPKLVWTSGNVWQGAVALEAGTAFSFSYIRRAYGVASWGSGTNLTVLGSPQAVTSPGHVAPPWGDKCLIYRSGFAQAFVLYRDLTHGGEWTERAMRNVGPGRTAGESTYRVDGVAPSGSLLEFVFHNGGGQWDNASAPPSGTAQGAAPAVPVSYQGLSGPYNYRTPLDVCAVQDGQVFNDLPAATVSVPRFETREISSTVVDIPGRPIRILLPRGYDTHPGKRYPVLYFHDGQNVFFPGGAFGTWDADRIANYETAQGRMRECILVSVPNGDGYGSNRIAEYTPNGDSVSYSGTTYQGKAADYVRFLLENVMPTLDQHYRTLGSAANTLTAGSSMGGLVADYIGFSQSGRFGGIGIFSPAYWAAPNWVAQRDAAPKLPVRRYLYMGTAESSTGESSSEVYWRDAQQAYDAYLRVGHAANGDLLFEGGAGAAHNEAAWALRLPAFFAFALDPMREASPLAQELFPPRLDLVPNGSGGHDLRYMGVLGTRQTIGHSPLLTDWSWEPELPAEERLWDLRTVPAPLAAPKPATMFWRLKQEPWAE